ncbi:unnamed protein product [Amoebophrya sp. A25]|nr:unnamed protein product [Amoebophrya sp. A25]|eukprot:GSA25T00017863001.1
MQALLWLFDWSRSLSDTVDEGANMGRVQALKEHLLGNLPTEDKWIREQRRGILDDLRSMINYDFSGTRPFHYVSI